MEIRDSENESRIFYYKFFLTRRYFRLLNFLISSFTLGARQNTASIFGNAITAKAMSMTLTVRPRVITLEITSVRR